MSRGDVWQFLGYNLAVMLLHTRGPKEDLWMPAKDPKYDGALFVVADLGQYGMSYSKFTRMMRCFHVPTNGDPTDPFDPIRLFVQHWNDNIKDKLVPGPFIIVDESMALWKGRGMPGLMSVPRKPTPLGRESHTTADGDTGAIIFVEPCEGKDRMAAKV